MSEKGKSSKTKKVVYTLIGLAVFGWIFMQFIYPPMFEWYTGVENAELTYESSVEVSDAEFQRLKIDLVKEEKIAEAEKLTWDVTDPAVKQEKINLLVNTPSFTKSSKFKHIKYFEEAGIRQYEGPETCMECHEEISVTHANGEVEQVNVLEDVVNSVHFQFQKTSAGFTTFGYDGRKVNEEGHQIPVGKIDRACGVPGSFSWTGWAELIATTPESAHGDTVWRSEGCGQCHIGGNYHPATEKMMPIGDVPSSAKQGVDCLICHSQTYDMNYRFVIQDEVGRRWNQDRTLKSAMAVTNPTNENCLNCHQHNMGGDAFAENISAKNLGYENQRLLHEGAKRANPFSPKHDVHYAAGLICTDCHVPEGHKIPRGTKGTDLVANDLPGKEVSCEMCHTSAPHLKDNLAAIMLNGHTDKLACETCHIKTLEEYNAVLRDWTNPTYNAEEGIYTPTDILHSGEEGLGYTFLWFNGNGTFLANALGNNPNNSDEYNPLMEQITGYDNPKSIAEIRSNVERLLGDRGIDIDSYMNEFVNTLSQMTPEMIEKRKEMIAKNIKPLQNSGDSRIYPFKLFNARMYEDLTNQGPFGAMILPFDYATYYESGDPVAAVEKAVKNPIVKRMYEYPFKAYMMDEFMNYFGVDEWSSEYPLDENGKITENVKPFWMRQYGTLMFNHGIQKEGRECVDCHSNQGIMPFEKLGYTADKSKMLRNLPEMKIFSTNEVVQKN
ncbi:MAG: hypothetical protein K9J12_01410 [Melioribacteraceae bacterium]|nr:hypothetical protein [Melioribacteraceae bacterium]MCF8265548.1 hypothetical protein [Melioribacteraceae bacterium]MCF8413857.1 hypothetical protein [Melioribacteraceae bacterium]MCF8432043.1 hypothetical protein [Melioribacteraceae bacterium]